MSSALRRIAERNIAEVDRVVRGYFNKLTGLEPVTRKQLSKLIRAGAVTVLDVRPPDEFDLGHLPGAVNIPLRALKARLDEINPNLNTWPDRPLVRARLRAVLRGGSAATGARLQGTEIKERPAGMARGRLADQQKTL